MPPKRKPGIQGGNRFKTEADRKRWERANETPEQTRLRLDTQSELQSAVRDGDSESETAARLQNRPGFTIRQIRHMPGAPRFCLLGPHGR